MPDEPKKFEDWWKAIDPVLRRVLAGFVGPRANDVAQDVAVLAMRNFGRFASVDDFARWCLVRGKWLALDELARSRRHPEQPIDSIEEPVADEQSSILLDLVPHIERLPDRQRRVVIYKLMGYRTDEIARALKIRESAVRSHWRFAQQSLANQTRDERDS